MTDDARGALFRQGAGALLQDELVRFHDLAESGNATAKRVMDWILQAENGGELLNTVPESAADLVELLGEVGRTAEYFVLARALAFMLKHDDVPTHFRLRVIAEFERI